MPSMNREVSVEDESGRAASDSDNSNGSSNQTFFISHLNFHRSNVKASRAKAGLGARGEQRECTLMCMTDCESEAQQRPAERRSFHLAAAGSAACSWPTR